MTESVGSAADNLEEDDANEVLLDELRRQKKDCEDATYEALLPFNEANVGRRCNFTCLLNRRREKIGWDADFGRFNNNLCQAR